MSPEVFNTVCVPLIGVGMTAMLAISTPDDEFNFYTELFEMINPLTGELFFYLIKIGLACQTCLESGNPCNHQLDKLPHWKPVERQLLINQLLSSNPDLANRETRGVVQSSKRPVFDQEHIAALGRAAMYSFNYSPSVLWLAIDPAGGGSQSDFAMATMAFEDCRELVTLHYITLALS